MFKQAQKQNSYLKIALTGPSGSGKTYSALRLAKGLTDNGNIAVIDTENGSASLYSNKFSFDVCDVEPPYSIDKLVEAAKYVMNNDYDILLIDSGSHWWTGILDFKEKLDSRNPGGNHFTNWSEANKHYSLLLRIILQSKIHVIVCLRSKTDYILEKDDRGKSVPRKVGLAPITREGMDYEFSCVLDISLDHNAKASKDRTELFGDKIFQITEQTGVLLRDWLNESSGASKAQPEEPPIPEEVFLNHHE